MTVEIETLGWMIKQVQWRQHRALDASLHAIGSTIVQWEALRAIANDPGACAHDLAVATFQSDQAFGTLASRLVAQGLIERRRGRGRRIAHNLTPSGEALLAAGRVLAREILDASFVELSDGECGQLFELLGRVGPNARVPDPTSTRATD